MAELRHVGLTHPSEVSCAAQLSKRWDTAGNQPLPPGQGAVVTPDSVGIDDIGDGISFLLLGDCGGIEDPNPQKAVAAAMVDAIRADPSIKFAAICGDVCYFNGDPSQYMPQFWQPWAYVKVPFIAVPGNHDGDPTDDVTGAGIDSFMVNWCAETPGPPPGDPQLEFGRDTQTLPYCYWAIQFKSFLLIGLYSNVASGGYLDATQQAFLTSTLAKAPGVPSMVLLHHPPFSVDAMSGGSRNMLDDLDNCFEQANRWPTVVAAAHIHDNQRFTRTIAGGEDTMTYLVSGNGGYHNKHAIAGDYAPGMDLGNGVVCDYADASQWGFVKITVKGAHMSGTYTQVPLSGAPTPDADIFTL